MSGKMDMSRKGNADKIKSSVQIDCDVCHHLWFTIFTGSGVKCHFLFITWVKKDNSLECCKLVVIYLYFLEGPHQLIQDSVGYPTDLWFRTVSVDHTAITCRDSE